MLSYKNKETAPEILKNSEELGISSSKTTGYMWSISA
jgi:hypothetical protein